MSDENWNNVSDSAGHSKADEFREILAEHNNQVCQPFNAGCMVFALFNLSLCKMWLSAAMVLVGINLAGCKGGNNQTPVGDTVMLTPQTLTQQQNPDSQQTVRPNERVCTVSRNKFIKGDVYTSVEQLPEFPGGMGNFFKFVKTHLKFPADANGAKGRVNVTFIVNRDGSLSDMKAIGRVSHPALEKEALRVMKLLPKWMPGKQNGKPVRVQYTVPIIFN